MFSTRLGFEEIAATYIWKSEMATSSSIFPCKSHRRVLPLGIRNFCREDLPLRILLLQAGKLLTPLIVLSRPRSRRQLFIETGKDWSNGSRKRGRLWRHLPTPHSIQMILFPKLSARIIPANKLILRILITLQN